MSHFEFWVFHRLGLLGRVGLVVVMSVRPYVCLSLIFSRRLMGPHDQILSTHCGINTLKNVTPNYWPSDHMISSCQPIVESILWINVTLNYYPHTSRELVSILCKIFSLTIWVATVWAFFSHNLSFLVLSQFEFYILSQFKFLSLSPFEFEFHHNLRFRISSEFYFFLISSLFEFLRFLSFNKIWVS